jgi:hypothetical protein
MSLVTGKSKWLANKKQGKGENRLVGSFGKWQLEIRIYVPRVNSVLHTYLQLKSAFYVGLLRTSKAPKIY